MSIYLMRPVLLVLVVGCWSSRPITKPISTPSDEVGTADPIRLLEVAADGRWIAVCQRRGPAIKPYLVYGAGAGEPLDLYLAKSRDDRWIAVARGGVAYAIDTQTRRTVELEEARLVDDGSSEGPTRDFAFGTAHVVFQRNNEVVIKHLQTRDEEVIPIQNKLWQVEVDDGGRWAKITMIDDDTDGDGLLAGPRQHDGRASRCLPPVKRTPPDAGDLLTVAWFDMKTGTYVNDRDAIDDGSRVIGGNTLGRDTTKPPAIPTGHRVVAHDLVHRRYLIALGDGGDGFDVGPYRWIPMR